MDLKSKAREIEERLVADAKLLGKSVEQHAAEYVAAHAEAANKVFLAVAMIAFVVGCIAGYRLHG